MEKINAHNLISAVEVEHPIQWCFAETEDLSVSALAASPYWEMRRQDLPKYYRANGAIFIVDARKILDPNYDYMSDRCHAYIMPALKSVDIDSFLDFEYVRSILNLTKEGL